MINENRWHALRDGLDCTLVDPDSGEVESARSRIGRLLLTLEPYAAELGCAEELALAWQLLNVNGAVHQRNLVARRGFPGLLRSLVEQTEKR